MQEMPRPDKDCKGNEQEPPYVYMFQVPQEALPVPV